MKTTKKIISIALAFVMLGSVGCQSVNPENTKNEKGSVAIDSKPLDKDGEPSIMEPNEITASFQSFAEDTVVEMLEGEQDKNRVYSPVSLYFALAQLREGANDPTGALLEERLHLEGIDKEKFFEYIDQFSTQTDHQTRMIANSMWLSEQMVFHPEPLERANQYYNSAAFTIDFMADNAAKQINEWISKTTRGFLGEGEREMSFEFTKDTAMVLLNTLYLKSEWIKPFDRELSEEGTFTGQEGQAVDKTFMVQSSNATAYQTPDAKIAQKAIYGGNIVFVLPREGLSVNDWIKNNSISGVLKNLEKDAREYLVEWRVPKFEVDMEMSMMDKLDGIGLGDLKNQIHMKPLSDEELSISDIRQLLRVAIDENGVEAAAATAIQMEKTMAPIEVETMEMDLNRPFVYMIVHEDGTPLFVGVINQ